MAHWTSKSATEQALTSARRREAMEDAIRQRRRAKLQDHPSLEDNLSPHQVCVPPTHPTHTRAHLIPRLRRGISAPAPHRRDEP